jgi:hypothetical protein
VNQSRTTTRSRAADDVASAFEVSDTPQLADVNAAIGAFAPQGARRLAVIAKKVGVVVFTAPFQAEEQLIFLQDQKVITIIAANDGDYIPMGGDSILFSNRLWSRNCRIWRKKNMKHPLAGGGGRGEEVNDSRTGHRGRG